MKNKNELNYKKLKMTCKPDIFKFETTENLESITTGIGQDRGIKALEFGMNVDIKGYNIYLEGPSGVGKTMYTKNYLKKIAKKKKVPSDWCYIYNFADPNAPIAVSLPAGHGKEFKDIVISTKCMDRNGDIFELSNEEQKFTYRHSVFFENEYIILETKLKLQKGDMIKIKEKMDEYISIRKEKQPLEYPSAGSTFKRGKDFITSKLIDEAGLKGYTIGGAQISEKHAGFIINKNNATSKDILDLIEYTKKKIFEKFGIHIEEEIEVIGEF